MGLGLGLGLGLELGLGLGLEVRVRVKVRVRGSALRGGDARAAGRAQRQPLSQRAEGGVGGGVRVALVAHLVRVGVRVRVVRFRVRVRLTLTLTLTAANLDAVVLGGVAEDAVARGERRAS